MIPSRPASQSDLPFSRGGEAPSFWLRLTRSAVSTCGFFFETGLSGPGRKFSFDIRQ